MSESKVSSEQVREESKKWSQLGDEVGKVVFGQAETLEKIVIGLLCNGHILLDGVPGLAKTSMVKTFAQCLGLDFSRIQFTPDLLPSDVTGSLIYNPKTHEFETKKGPIFAGVVLADEINRAPAKVQASLLEAMEEHQVTIGTTTFDLPSPLIVLATQNPIDQEGTYVLPEAQTDRFMFKVHLTYPKREFEREIVNRSFSAVQINKILNREEILAAQAMVAQIFIDEKVVDYILDIVLATRNRQGRFEKIGKLIRFGASPRATIFLSKAARARAFLNKRHFVTPDDVKAVAYDVLRHRLILTYEAEVDEITCDDVVEMVLKSVVSP
jgi:MoxR-like ATPase